MRKVFAAALVAFLATLGLAFIASPAQAAGVPLESTCNTGWYVNPDETAFLPEQVENGFKFEGKDLIHHEAPSSGIDLADMNSVNYTFDATTAGKVVFKVETSAPYSTIVTNADGKLWSTAMTYDQIGGQGNPVEKYTDFIGKPVKPGKVEFSGASQVETFGVGYWVEEGSTVVTSIKFHGTTYDLKCVPPKTESPTPTPTASESQSPSPTPTATESTSPAASPSQSQTQGPVEVKTEAPQIGKVTCDQFEVLTPDLKGVSWDVTDTKVDGNTVTIEVTATPQDGYVLVGDTKWTLSFEIPANCTATPEPTEVPTSPAAGNGGGDLALTGSSKSTLIGTAAAGVLLVSIGGILFTLARRRRDADTVESA